VLRETRILVADDDPDLRLLVRSFVARENGEVIEASTGAEALALARERRPDLVLLDLRLPGMDGHEVLRELRSDPSLSDLPVLVVSAFADQSSIDAALAAGATRYVTKPFDRKTLIGLIADEIRLATDEASPLTPQHELTLEALRLESPVLAKINRRIIANGGEPIPPRRQHLGQARDEGPA
jgi:CheY-like chemotaxis protein